MRRARWACSLALAWAGVAASAELTPADVAGPPSERASLAAPEHPAIAYASRSPNDVVAQWARRLDSGEAQLDFTAGQGYLPAVLDALGIARSSQLLVFSRTSLQRQYITAANPRAIYFNDAVAVAFIPGAPLLELAALDPEQGVVFYTLEQRAAGGARALRQESCLSCHLSRNSMDVPGMLVRSVPAGASGRLFPQIANDVTDHRSVLAERWGGWYVTGDLGTATHLGNRLVDAKGELASSPAPLATLADRLDLERYPAALSEVAAHLVFDHQMHMSNLLVRIGWEARVALSTDSGAAKTVTQQLLSNNARELVDYLLFVDEAPLAAGVSGGGAFEADFARQGPRDRQGRSLRELDLRNRLLRHPCSYMIYSAAFDALPSPAKQAIYRRLWSVLTGQDSAPRYRQLARSERRAILEILRDTKSGLPGYFF